MEHYEIDGPPEQDTGLACTGTSWQIEWAMDMHDGLALLLIGMKMKDLKELFKRDYRLHSGCS